MKVVKFKLEYKSGEEIRDGGCLEAARLLVDGWEAAQGADMTVTEIQGGITNLLYKVDWSRAPRGVYQSALVRIFGDNTEIMIDRERDNKTFQALSDRGFSPVLHGVFDNGRVEQWLESRPLEDEEMSQRSPIDFPTLIAPELARMHALDIPGDKGSILWNFLNQWYDMAAEIKFDDDPAKAAALKALDLPRLRKELDWVSHQLPSHHNGDGEGLLAEVRASGSAARLKAAQFVSDVVFSHNDLLSGNVLLLKGSNPPKIKIIDYEYGGYNYRGFDFANHFCEYMGFEFDLRNYPDRLQKIHFLKNYLKTSAPEVLTSLGDSTEARDEFFSQLVTLVDRFALASHFFWGLWAIIQSRHSPIDFDFMGYAHRRFLGYWAHKRRFFEIDDAPPELAAFDAKAAAAAAAAETSPAATGGAGGAGDAAAVADSGDKSADDAADSGSSFFRSHAVALSVVGAAVVAGCVFFIRSRSK